jgi:lipoprotein-anchoring transpeptidase ErfK/SrfK
MRLPVPLLIALVAASAAHAQSARYVSPGRPLPRTPPMVVAVPAPQPTRTNIGGGFIEFLFGNGSPRVAAPPPRRYYAAPQPVYANAPPQPVYVNAPAAVPMQVQPQARPQMDPRFLPREVAFNGTQAPGTIVIDTPNHFLYLVEAGGRARRYGIGVGRPGFTWTGTHAISAKKEWPDWVPPKEMLERQPYLPHFMAGGPRNPLGARALYLGSTLYRIHGSNEPWTIGHNVSSGCIRMRNVDVIDLYNRVKVGTKVVVL